MVEPEAVDVNRVLAEMDAAQARVNIVILDACRDNPYARSFRSGSRGLAQIDAPRGTLIAYATAPGKVAEDGPGQNSPYTAALAKHIAAQGLSIESVLKRVRVEVLDQTGNRQEPWEASSLTGDFFFFPAGAVVRPLDPTPSTSATPQWSDWMGGKEYQAAFDIRFREGFYPARVEGAQTFEGARFRAVFEKLPAGAYFYSYHGLTEDRFTKRDAELAPLGFHRIWIQTFIDANGRTRYQATWIKPKFTGPRQ
jgi:hypothetical protein